MDIKAAIPTIPTSPAVTASGEAAHTPPAKESARPEQVERKLQDTFGSAPKAAPGLRVPHTRAEIEFDKTLNRVVGRIVDEETGEAIHEIPPEELKALYTKMREQLGSLVDETA